MSVPVIINPINLPPVLLETRFLLSSSPAPIRKILGDGAIIFLLIMLGYPGWIGLRRGQHGAAVQAWSVGAVSSRQNVRLV
jgi:hypothetical protein